MFKQVTLKNFRTHKSTSIELYPVTLLIGNNNSGKTNLLMGIQHFSQIVSRGNPNSIDKSVYADKDLFPNRYRLSGDDEPMTFSIQWVHMNVNITYEISIYINNEFTENAGCKEKIALKLASQEKSKEVTNGYDKPTNILGLREKIQQVDGTLTKEEIDSLNLFFNSLARIFSYHFQPAFLKGGATEKTNYLDNLEDHKINDTKSLRISSDFGETGSNFQSMLNYIKLVNERVFSLFIAKMRTIDTSFLGVHYDEKLSSLIWEFDLGRKGYVEEFTPDLISDGFMKIAAISLLASLPEPPAMIMLEEVENGINPGNIQQLMNWIWQATSPSKGLESQFILTSHSPSVLREFNDYPDHVYTVRLDKRSRQSDVRNLNTSLDTLVGIGAINDDDVEYINNENTGKRLIKIPKYQLAELWYSGTIG